MFIRVSVPQAENLCKYLIKFEYLSDQRVWNGQKLNLPCSQVSECLDIKRGHQGRDSLRHTSCALKCGRRNSDCAYRVDRKGVRRGPIMLYEKTTEPSFTLVHLANVAP